MRQLFSFVTIVWPWSVFSYKVQQYLYVKRLFMRALGVGSKETSFPPSCFSQEACFLAGILFLMYVFGWLSLNTFALKRNKKKTDKRKIIGKDLQVNLDVICIEIHLHLFPRRVNEVVSPWTLEARKYGQQFLGFSYCPATYSSLKKEKEKKSWWGIYNRFLLAFGCFIFSPTLDNLSLSSACLFHLPSCLFLQLVFSSLKFRHGKTSRFSLEGFGNKALSISSVLSEWLHS